ncbi:MAG: hypothetical protein ACTH6Y_12280 [Vibrio hibernica]
MTPTKVLASSFVGYGVFPTSYTCISKIPIKDITSAKQLKMTVLRNVQGDLKLGFHNDKDNEHSYDSVALEHAQSLLPELKHVIETSELDNNTSEQDDLFGFVIARLCE